MTMTKAEITRFTILQKAYEIIYKNGYQITSIDEIIAATQVTKGAFFYHFKNKDEMGLAMIREILYPGMYKALVEPLLQANDPLRDIHRMLKVFLLDHSRIQIKYGCPAVNLVEEMAPLNPKFNKALSILTMEWMAVLEKAIQNGKSLGLIRKDVNPRQVAQFIISGYSGIRNMGKLDNDVTVYNSFLKEMKNYLTSLA